MAEFKKREKFGKPGGFKRGGDRPSFGGKPSFGPKFGAKRGAFDGGERTFHDAVCSRCSKECQVPFRPNGEKPVLCRDCFRTNAPDSGDRPTSGYPKRDFGGSSFSRPAPRATDSGSSDMKRQLELVNIKLDKLIQLIKDAKDDLEV